MSDSTCKKTKKAHHLLLGSEFLLCVSDWPNHKCLDLVQLNPLPQCACSMHGRNHTFCFMLVSRINKAERNVSRIWEYSTIKPLVSFLQGNTEFLFSSLFMKQREDGLFLNQEE